MSHTYARLAIAAGVSLFALARRMGTSVEQIDDYELLPDDCHPAADPAPYAASNADMRRGD